MKLTVKRFPFQMGLIFIAGCAFCLQTPGPRALGSPQQPAQKPQPQQTGETIRVNTEEVLLDIVVRDKKGRPVNDLKESDIEVYEDGAKQKIVSFRQITAAGADSAAGQALAAAGANPTAGNPSAANSPPDPMRQVNLVTMVFERLNNESRQQSRQAAEEFLKTNLGPNVFVAVYALDQRLRVIQPFTANRERLKAAVEVATGANSSQFADRSEGIRRELENAIRAGEGLANLTGNIGQAGAPPGIGQAAAEQKFAEMTLNTLRAEDNADQQIQGTTSVYSLLSLVAGQRQLLGRKTVLYFSEGMQIPPTMVDLFRAAIGAANRANVSFYTIDARGLGSAVQMEAQRDTLLAAARSSQSQQTSPGSRPITFDQAGALETAESSMRRNRQATLGELAESTGGFLIANTNDFRKSLQRVASELNSYYAATYAPPAREDDGKFRQITVKTLRSDIVVQTRSGYFALPPSDGAPLMPFEMPLLAALSSKPLPRDFDVRAQTLRFAARKDGFQHLLILETPLSNVTFEMDQEKKIYRTHFSLLAVVKNAEGRVVQRFSQDSPVEGPLDRLELLKRGNFVFVRNFTLPPGRYTLETAVRDWAGNKLSVRRSILMVQPPRPGVALSSVTVIKRIDPVDPNVKDPDNPLRFAEGKIVPNLGETIQSRPGAQLSFYFTVYPLATAADKPALTLEFLLDGAVIARATPELGPPDAEGRIPYIALTPMETFKPGRYEVRVVVRQGQQAAEEHAFFTIE